MRKIASGKTTTSVGRKKTAEMNAAGFKRGFRTSSSVHKALQVAHKCQDSSSSDQLVSESEGENESTECCFSSELSGSNDRAEARSSSERDQQPGSAGVHHKKRYILFLGNLPHDASRVDIIQHFSRRGVPISELRLLTDKESGKSKGCAFAEFSNNKAMQNALKFHRSKLQGRTMNVEVTCGGGGKGNKRQLKIRERNRTQRRTKTVKSGRTIKVGSRT